jgi:hypothetical protein
MFRSSKRSSSGSSLFTSLSMLLILKIIKIFKKYYQFTVVVAAYSSGSAFISWNDSLRNLLHFYLYICVLFNFYTDHFTRIITWWYTHPTIRAWQNIHQYRAATTRNYRSLSSIYLVRSEDSLKYVPAFHSTIHNRFHTFTVHHSLHYTCLAVLHESKCKVKQWNLLGKKHAWHLCWYSVYRTFCKFIRLTNKCTKYLLTLHSC